MNKHKKYTVKFTHGDGKIEEVKLVTDRIDWSIDQWCRNRFIVDYKIIKEEKTNNDTNSQMLFG